MTIGPYGPLTLDQAREKATALLGDIANGLDPAQIELDRKRELTFGDLEVMYRERHLPRKRSAHNDEILLKNYLLGWKNRKLSSITRKDVVALHAEIGQNNGHYAANRIVSLLRKMYNLASVWGVYIGENPGTKIETFREEKRDRFILPEELPRLLESLKGERNIYVRGVVFTLLLTGQRKTECLTMRWENIRFDEGTWHIPQTKSGKPHLIPLPGPVLELLKVLPHVADNPYVFCGSGNSYIKNLQERWEIIRDRAGLPDLRLHDLRRTNASYLASAGESLPLIGRILGHTQPSTTMIYARLALEPVRAALEANAQRMLLLAGKNPANEEAKDHNVAQEIPIK